MSVTVLPGNHVEHDGVSYHEGEVIESISDKQAQALVDAGSVTTGAKSGQPSEEEVAAAAAAAAGQSGDQNSEQKKGLFR